MPRSLARLSASESSHRDLSSTVFITNILEYDFRYTHPVTTPQSETLLLVAFLFVELVQKRPMVDFTLFAQSRG